MGDMEPQKFNTGMSRMPKHQKRALGSWKAIYANEGDIWQEEDNDGNIEILLFFPRNKKGESRGVIVGMASPEGYIGP